MKKLEMLKEIMEVNSIVNEKEIKTISKEFNLKNQSVEQLAQIRKDVIIYCSDIKMEARMNGDWKTFDIYNNLSSKICAVIEREIYNR